MNVMRRIKSIASGRTSISDPGGDYTIKRAKVEQETDGNLADDSHLDERCTIEVDQHMVVTSMDVDASTSDANSINRPEKVDYDKLPKEMHGMRIQDNKADTRDEKEMEAAHVSGNGTETGQIITTTIGGKNGQPKQTVSYMAERVVGTGSFGVVFQANCLETGEQVAIKKVLQDKRYKNRELQIMRILDHPNVVQLKHCFYSTTEKDEVYLNLVLEYVPETIYRVIKHYNKMGQHMPMICVQLYAYQICRGLNYMHCVMGVCHRDIKPQNLLVNPDTHQVKLCDLGSAKMLVPGEPNISYICSRYYRAPELIFGATEYTTAIDMWSVGCVLAELLLGQPLFPGESGVDQLVEIIKVHLSHICYPLCVFPSFMSSSVGMRVKEIGRSLVFKPCLQLIEGQEMELVPACHLSQLDLPLIVEEPTKTKVGPIFILLTLIVPDRPGMWVPSSRGDSLFECLLPSFNLGSFGMMWQILGTPTREEIKCMNPNYSEFKFPQIKAHPWHKVFHKRMPSEAVDLASRLLQYSPKLRCTALEALAHPFFDDLREVNACLPNGKPFPPLFNFTPRELAHATPQLRARLLPKTEK